MCNTQAARASVLMVLACTALPSPAQADPSWADRLRSEALPAWDAALADQVSVQGTGRLARQFVNRTSEFEYGIKVNSECALITEKRGKDGPTEVYAYNPRYTFRLRSTPDRGWAIVSVHIGDPATDGTARNIRKFIDPYTKLAGYGFRIPHGLEPLAAYVRGPTTRVVSVTPTTWKGIEAAEVKLDIAPAAKGDEVRSITSLHDPSRQWRTLRTVVAGQRALEGKATTFEETVDYEYAPGPDNLVSRTLEQDIWKDADGKSTPIKAERVFEMQRLKVLPDTSEFTLSAFGLPEPVGVEWPRRRTGWLWLAWAGAGFVAVAAVFAALKRRAARRQAVPQPTPS